jgi:hypothetical protein
MSHDRPGRSRIPKWHEVSRAGGEEKRVAASVQRLAFCIACTAVQYATDLYPGMVATGNQDCRQVGLHDNEQCQDSLAQ